CGLAATRRLASLRPDEEILLIEADRIGYGVSGRSAGFMLNLHSHGVPKDLDVLRRTMRFWSDGLSALRTLVREHQIQCDWSDWGRLYGAAGPDSDRNMDMLADTLDSLDQTFELRSRDQMIHDLGTDFYHRGLFAGGNALVNPAALMRGLAQTLPANVVLFEKSPVLSLEKRSGLFHLETAQGSVTADKVVLTTGAHLQHFGIGRGRYVPIATYASLSAPLSEEQASIFRIGEEAAIFSTSENGATIRLTRDRRLFFRNRFTFNPSGNASGRSVAVAGAMHRGGIRRRWPMLADLEIPYVWGGVMAFTANNGTVFGEIEPDLFAVLTHDIGPTTRGTSMGGLIADLIEGCDSPLLGEALSIPNARRLPPRPILDLGVAWELNRIRRQGAGEF
ncbi:MAG: FAD-binding oxidoreductase, partial [Rhodospirillaceae bacterium]|nr:FAD-binding oxidoreductase [Rhodospirillaceae bacterium]